MPDDKQNKIPITLEEGKTVPTARSKFNQSGEGEEFAKGFVVPNPRVSLSQARANTQANNQNQTSSQQTSDNQEKK